jgi:hypothetical protein
VLSMSAFELGNPVIFCVGMVADNLSFHVNKIARAQPKVFRGQASKTQPHARDWPAADQTRLDRRQGSSVTLSSNSAVAKEWPASLVSGDSLSLTSSRDSLGRS